MPNLNDISAATLAKGIKNKEFSCEEVMQAYQQRIAEVNPILNALVQPLDPEQAISLAKQADTQLAKGENIGPLHGVPMTIKDHIKVKDFIVTRGCMGLKDYRCKDDAPIVKRLKQSGAIILGITNMPEMGPSFETDNDVYGETKNPYDLTKTPGGSSGGEAALIASGGTAAGIGSDGGGSIRLPSHFSGVAGLKPTQNLISCTGNAPMDGGLAMSYYTPGPMARHVEDLRLILPVISGWDGIDPYTMPQAISQTVKPIKDLKVGFLINTNVCTVSKPIEKTLLNAVDSFKANGASINEIDFIDVGEIGLFLWETYFVGGDQGQLYKDMLIEMGVKTPSKIMQNYFRAAERCEKFALLDFKKRLFKADQMRMHCLQAMQDYDVILTPTCATTAKSFGTTHDQLQDFVYTLAFNLLRYPGCVVRCGEDESGLPIGLQVLAKPWQDYQAIAVAEFLEKEFGGWQKPNLS